MVKGCLSSYMLIRARTDCTLLLWAAMNIDLCADGGVTQCACVCKQCVWVWITYTLQCMSCVHVFFLSYGVHCDCLLLRWPNFLGVIIKISSEAVTWGFFFGYSHFYYQEKKVFFSGFLSDFVYREFLERSAAEKSHFKFPCFPCQLDFICHEQHWTEQNRQKSWLQPFKVFQRSKSAIVSCWENLYIKWYLEKSYMHHRRW